MRLDLELVIECSDERAARSLALVLAPDNRAFPRDQKFSFKREGRSLRLRVESPRPKSVMATVASVLADTRLFHEVWGLAR